MVQVIEVGEQDVAHELHVGKVAGAEGDRSETGQPAREQLGAKLGGEGIYVNHRENVAFPPESCTDARY